MLLEVEMTVLVVDQASTLTPAFLKQFNLRFDILCQDVLQCPGSWGCRHTPMVLEVNDTYVPPFATTTIRDDNGRAVIWKMRWDSGG